MIYFAFSDECGLYQTAPSEKTKKAHPFYIRATFLMHGSDWKLLNRQFNELKENLLGLNLKQEIKWSDVQLLKEYEKNGKAIRSSGLRSFLTDLSSDTLLKFIQKSIGFLATLDYCKIILSVTFNEKHYNCKQPSMMRFHLQEHLQRIQMEIQNCDQNLAVIFFDPVSKKQDDVLREAYFHLFKNGDFIKEYSHVKDSINFESSHHSVGVQIADYLAGCFPHFLKGYHPGCSIFMGKILPRIRAKSNGNVLGYGIIEVPKNEEVRAWIKKKIEQASGADYS